MAFKFSRPSISWVFHQNKQNIVLINNWRTIWHTEIIMSFLSFSDNLLQDAYIIFPKSVDNFAIAHKHAKFWLRCSTPLITQLGGRCIPIATLSFNLFIFITLSNKEVLQAALTHERSGSLDDQTVTECHWLFICTLPYFDLSYM